MCPEEPGDFERFLKFAKLTEYEPAPSRDGVYKPVNSRKGFSKVLSAITPDDIPLVLATGADKFGWFTEGVSVPSYPGAPGPAPVTTVLNPTSRARRLLDWIMEGKP